MRRYAEETTVPVEQSRAEIERLLARYGATAFSYAQDVDRGMAAISFAASKRLVRFIVRMPRAESFSKTRTGRDVSEGKQVELAAQEGRRLWRSLVLMVKAKLDSVASGIATFEDEFLAYIVLPTGGTAGEFMRPQIAAAYDKGTPPLPLALPPASETKTDPKPAKVK